MLPSILLEEFKRRLHPPLPQLSEREHPLGAVDSYGVAKLHPNDRPNASSLELALEYIISDGLPDASISLAFRKFLALQCRTGQVKNVLLVGLHGGYATTWIATMNPQVHITALEADSSHAQMARENINKAGVSSQRPRYEFAFIDAGLEHSWDYTNKAICISRPGANIIVNKVVQRGEVADTEPETVDMDGAQKVIERTGMGPRVEACLMQQVSDKGYDGYLMAVVK
ncbi:hypothetical protein ANOM_003716 [Aspergillus nomiae NRRL 13137]|uniref:O-methyltransferase n=1 Tax=Aspergillus nomiae NRRL (strain ATCC 15546 / NRRL 13137 / CBS 260.88 / M93) TaxID=1509407 RepID=A0A0L1JAQ0_ASPN3|nr:uncharacterized protein ANOM_003716 [Aspergillus nomiae NRRL 13137]KNG88871.1 hypothetical protein ANOM_003716 [Aspergillus nomiae NRRL 13137]